MEDREGHELGRSKSQAEIQSQQPPVADQIRGFLQAKEKYRENHADWETKKEGLKKAGIPEENWPNEPEHTETAIRGEELVKMSLKTSDEFKTALEKQWESADRTAVDTAFQNLEGIIDPLDRYICSTGAGRGILERSLSTRFADLNRLIRLCPDIVQSEHFGKQSLKCIPDDFKLRAGALLDPQTGELLESLLSDHSALSEEGKTKVRFIQAEGLGLRLYKVVSGYEKSQKPMSATDILGILKLPDQSGITENDIMEAAGNLSIQRVNLPLLVAKLSRREGLSQSTQERLQGIAVGVIESTFSARPDSQKFGGDRNAQTEWTELTNAAVAGLINLHDPEAVGFLDYVTDQRDNSPMHVALERTYQDNVKNFAHERAIIQQNIEVS